MGKGSLRQEPEAIVVYLFLQGPNWSHHCSLWFGTLAGSHCNADKCTLSFWMHLLDANLCGQEA